jgi:hypothetical protein
MGVLSHPRGRLFGVRRDWHQVAHFAETPHDPALTAPPWPAARDRQRDDSGSSRIRLAGVCSQQTPPFFRPVTDGGRA